MLRVLMSGSRHRALNGGPHFARPRARRLYRGSPKRVQSIKWRDHTSRAFVVFGVVGIAVALLLVSWLITHPETAHPHRAAEKTRDVRRRAQVVAADRGRTGGRFSRHRDDRAHHREARPTRVHRCHAEWQWQTRRSPLHHSHYTDRDRLDAAELGRFNAFADSPEIHAQSREQTA